MGLITLAFLVFVIGLKSLRDANNYNGKNRWQWSIEVRQAEYCHAHATNHAETKLLRVSKILYTYTLNFSLLGCPL